MYSQQGRGGGWSLVGGARTDLSGLSAPDARALFLVAGPSSVPTPELKAALRKLVHALPEPMRRTAEAASGAGRARPRQLGWTAASAPMSTNTVRRVELARSSVATGSLANG